MIRYTCICLGLVVILILVLMDTPVEGLTNGEKVTDLIGNRHLFDPLSTFNKAKSHVSWIDPITYYDAVDLFHSDKFTQPHLSNIL
jgi:hypothetical protein